IGELALVGASRSTRPAQIGDEIGPFVERCADCELDVVDVGRDRGSDGWRRCRAALLDPLVAREGDGTGGAGDDERRYTDEHTGDLAHRASCICDREGVKPHALSRVSMWSGGSALTVTGARSPPKGMVIDRACRCSAVGVAPSRP